MGIEKIKGHPLYLKNTDLEFQIIFADADDFDSLFFKYAITPNDGDPKTIYRYRFGEGFIRNSAVNLKYPASISVMEILGESSANNPLILTGHRVADGRSRSFEGWGAFALSLGVVENPDDPEFLEKIGEVKQK